MDYEYAVFSKDNSFRRDGMTAEQAQSVLTMWKNNGGADGALELFRRPTGPWEAVDEPIEVTVRKNRRPKRTPDVVKRFGW